MDAPSEIRLSEVHPKLADRVRSLSDALETVNITIRITQGLRTWGEQDTLYAQGRTAPGSVVTNAKGGYSAHNFGYAVDFVCMNAALPDWNRNDAQWQGVLLEAQKHGLAEGASWRTFPDYPHLYLQELPADPDDEMRYVFQEKGMDALWAEWNIQ